MDKELQDQLKDMQSELKDLTRILQGTSKTAVQNTKSTAAELATRNKVIKMMKEQKKVLEERGELTEELNKEIDESIDSLNKFQKSAKSGSGVFGVLIGAVKAVGSAIMSVATAALKTAVKLSDTTESFSGVKDLVEAGFGDIPLVGVAMKTLASDIDSNVESFKQLSKVGASFGSSIVQLRELQNTAGMPLTKFTDLIGGNSEMLAKLFGTVDQGVPQIAGLTRSLREITEKDFAKFGLTLDDTAEYMMTYQNLERARGNTAKMSQADLLKGTASYTKNLVMLSKLTGKSVDQLNEQNAALAADGVFMSVMNDKTAEDALKLGTAINSLPPGLAQLGKEIIGVGAPVSEVARELEAASNGKFGEAFKKFERDGDLVSFNNSIKEISAETMQNSKSFGQAALVSGKFVEALNSMAAAAGKATTKLAMDDEMAPKSADNIENLVNLGSQTDLVKTSMENLRMKAMEPLIFSGGTAAETTKKLGGMINDLAQKGIPKFTNMIEKAYEFMDIKTGKPVPEFNNGTDGFQNFGSGTKVKLHDSEAVVPEKSSLGQMLKEMMATGMPPATEVAPEKSSLTQMIKDLMGTGMPMTEKAQRSAATTNNNTATTATNTTTNNTAAPAVDMTTLNTNTTELIEVNKKVAEHLNTLVTIGAMTEKNTKSTNNSLANLSGSLV